MEFRASERMEGDCLHLVFEGPIDEDTVFPEVDASKFKKVMIDLKGVKSINSVGIREWLDWIKPLAERTDMTFFNCPKALVFQFNMVEGFLPPKTQVKSFYVPFFCERCDREENVLFENGKHVRVANGNLAFDVDPKAAAGCTQSDCEIEMDVTESKYFQFLKR